MVQYTVFGQVISGLEVLDKIAALPRDRRDRPLTDLKMTMTVEKTARRRKSRSCTATTYSADA
ncbi:MAG: peptidylprolyl isomerase [Hymenobacter sp.]